MKKSKEKSKLIQHNILNINARDDAGYSMLHHAVLESKLQRVKYLLINKAEIDALSDEGDAPLYIAALKGDWSIVKHLVSNGANVNIVGHEGNTPIHLAAQYGNLPIVKYLIQKGATLDASDNDGNNMFHYVCEEGNKNIKVIEYFLSKYSQLNKENLLGETPVKVCISMNQFVAAKYMINCGVAVDSLTVEFLEYYENFVLTKEAKLDNLNKHGDNLDFYINPEEDFDNQDEKLSDTMIIGCNTYDKNILGEMD